MNYKWWLITTVSLFGVGLAFGAFTYTPASLSEQTSEFQKLAGWLLTLPRPLMALMIFFKNLLVVLTSIAFSPLFLIQPVIILLFNGWFIGLLSAAVVQDESIWFLLAGLLPHGIFELPALFMGEALAFSFGATLLRAFFKGQTGDLVARLKKDLRLLVPITVLFLIAAVIETYVTPAAIKLAM